ncbi:hypothetical protein B0T22DRAFT_385515 [Podospora appendiculata]|uniref:DUF726-domain-containing protein n=1 Tax=Podospora appendiculata TaxID=314037 RepID=A0AAE0X2I2_9PEZI|nr:hypothetical protein B0T22DRAFT_385515 [Podospora appendiculata]
MDEPKDATPILDSKEPPTSVEPESTKSQPSTSDDNSTDMAPGGKPRPHLPKRETDLSSVLTLNEKNELVSLIGKLTDTIQKHIIQVFDSTGVDDDAGPVRTSFWSKLPSHLRDLSVSRPQPAGKKPKATNQKENVAPSGSAPNGNSTDTFDAGAQSSFEHDEEEPIVMPRLPELKKEVLQHFKKWQTAVQKRVGDISVKKSPDPQAVPSGTFGPKQKPFVNKKNKSNGSKSSFVEPDPRLIRLYPPTSTSLCSLPLEKRTLLLHSMLLLLLSLEHYTAYSRVLLLHLTSSLHITLRILADDEVRVAKSLAQIAKDISPDELTQKKSEEGKTSRRWKVGIASVAGAAVIGITGGLAAPLVAAGIGTVLGGVGLGGTAVAGLLGTMAESSLLVGSLFGIYGARASGKLMEQYAKDVQDFAFLPLRGSIGEEIEIGKIEPSSRRLRVVFGISGWLTREADVIDPWMALGQESEAYAVRWELESLLKLGNSLETVVKSAAWSKAKKEIIARTSEPRSKLQKQNVASHTNKCGPVFASLVQSLWPLSLLKISKIIDNPWSIGMVRADKAGAILADVIMSKAQGERGVTLIGFSLGARVIYTCLMRLAERRAFGLIENAVMMGTPAPSDARTWCTMKSVVAGRLVNVYSENDYILGFLYRTSSVQYGVAGLQRIDGIDGVENVDVSAKVSGHLRYQFLVGSILKHIGWEDIDQAQVAKGEESLASMEEAFRQREQRREAIEPEGGEAQKIEEEVKKMEEEVKQKNAKGEQEVIRTRARARRARGKK